MSFASADKSDGLVMWETNQGALPKMGRATPRFLQGVFPFVGRGLFEILPLDSVGASLAYTVPENRTAQLVYFRAGNHSDDLLYLAVAVNGVPARYFPVGPKSDFHVPLAIVESHPAGTRIEIVFAAPAKLSGTLIVDAGIVEHEA